jgi:hypothetical protein
MFAKTTISILSAGAVLALAAPAMADPPHWAPAHGYRAKQNVVVHKHVQPVVNRKVVVHHHQPVVRRTVVHRYHEPYRTVVVHRPAPVYVAPAPVYAAPAPVYHQPNIFGTVVGGVIGAMIGSHVGGEMATGAGAVIGGVIGSGF